jgi:UDPglucose 6-dehydrogenase
VSRLGVIGAGYVGLTSAACFAHLGHDVVCADTDANKVKHLRKGEVAIHEEGLTELVAEGLAAERLRFVETPQDAARDAEIIFLCVPTPQSEDGDVDLSMLESALESVAEVLTPGAIVVSKSTVPVGTAAHVGRRLHELGIRGVGVAANPEFLSEGAAVRHFLNPTRVVIGADDPAVAVRISGLYGELKAPVIVTDTASAEMIKYASNAFLATKLSFVNEIANLCEATHADVRDVVLGMGYDPRIGFEYLQPGPGWGGSCLPKDTQALLFNARAAGYDFQLLRSAIDVNAHQRERTFSKIRDACVRPLCESRVAVWGLTFKAGTDDLRDSPALAIVEQLVSAGAAVTAYDPIAIEDAAGRGFDVALDPYEACGGADVLAVLTEWDEFRWFDFERVRAQLRSACIVDARNLLDPTALRRLGFTYLALGR